MTAGLSFQLSGVQKIPQRIAMLWTTRDPTPKKGQKSQRFVCQGLSIEDNAHQLMRSRAQSAQSSSPSAFLFFVSTDETPTDGLDLIPSVKTTGRGRAAWCSQRQCFHTRRLESRSIHHKYMSNRGGLSSSNIIQPHAKCVGYIRPLPADQELDKSRGWIDLRTSALLFLPITLCWLVCVVFYPVYMRSSENKKLLFTCSMEIKLSACDLFVNMDSFWSFPRHNLNRSVSRRICSLADKLHLGVSPDVLCDYCCNQSFLNATAVTQESLSGTVGSQLQRLAL